MNRAAFVLLIGLLVTACYRETSEAELARVRASGDRIVQQIERFRSQAGRYPHSLEEAKIKNARTAIGEFSYEVHDAGQSGEFFVLSAGSYDRDGYTIFWNSDARAWDQDE